MFCFEVTWNEWLIQIVECELASNVVFIRNKQTNKLYFRLFSMFHFFSIIIIQFILLFIHFEKNDTIFFLSLHYYYDYEFNNWNSLVGRKKNPVKTGIKQQQNKTEKMIEWHLHTYKLIPLIDISLSLHSLSLSFYAWFRQNQFVNYLFIHSE